MPSISELELGASATSVAGGSVAADPNNLKSLRDLKKFELRQAEEHYIRELETES